MTTHSYDLALNLIEAISARYEAKFDEKSKKAWAKELESYSKADLQKAYERFKIEYESLPFRFSVSAGLIKQLKPAFSTATVEERLFAALDDKDPYSFLKQISPKLCELASQANIFDRGLTSEGRSIAIHKVAQRFAEWQKNKERGFDMPEPSRKLLAAPVIDFEKTENPYRGMTIEEAAKKAAEDLKKKGIASELIDKFEKGGKNESA